MEGVESGREPDDNVLFVDERPEGTSRRVVGVDVWIIGSGGSGQSLAPELSLLLFIIFCVGISTQRST